MKIKSISITGKDSQAVTYLDDDGKEQTRITPLIGEDGLLLGWMKANKVVEPVEKEKPVEVAGKRIKGGK